MSYVPPALRHKQEEASKGEKGVEDDVSASCRINNKPPIHSLKDIQKHFWPTWIPETPALNFTSDDDSAADKRPQSNAYEIPPARDNDSDAIKLLAASTESDVPTSEMATEPATEGMSPQQAVSSKTGDFGSLSAKPAHQPSSSTEGVSNGSAQHRIREKEKSARRSDSLTLESVHPHNTLNNTEEAQESLQYVLLFHNANPRWLTDNIIYVKSALDLLPTQDHDKQKGNQEGPLAKQIMIFEQQNTHKTVSNAMFIFLGYFNLVNTQILEPQTPELVRMQEQKWIRTDKFGRARPINRNAESWKKSLTQRWAVLKFEKDEQASKDMQPPQVESSSTPRDITASNGQDRKSVNEMLKEMRMRDGL